MPYNRKILEFVHQLLRQQSRRSDYDDLYFGLQDLEMMLEDEYRKPKRKSQFDYSKAVYTGKVRKKRKLSGWQKFIKANSKKPRFKLRSGKLNLKKMGVAYRKTSAYKRSKK